MGLIKQAFFHDNAYHKINSFQYHKDKEILRIGVDVYPTAAKEEVIGSTEYQIVEKNFIDNSRMEAEKAIDREAIKKIADNRIENEKAVSQPAKQLVLKEETEFAITEKMKLIGKGKMKSLFKDIETKIFSLLYENLKKYSKKDELNDAEDS